MALKSNLGNLLLYFGLYGICTGFLQENCTNYMQQFERVYSVPGDAAMLNSTLVSPDVFNYTSVPYNITWYNLQTGQKINSQRGRVLVMGETLWLLNLTLADDGEYLVILRTPVRCYQQSIILVVDLPSPGLCGKPRKIDQILTKGVSDQLSCPLKDYINKLNSYNISSTLRWYRGCDIINNTEKYIYKDKTKLLIKGVDSENHHSYTCTLSFNLGGGMGLVSETIDAVVREEYFMVPQVREPTNTAFKVHVGSSFSQRCRVFVPGVGLPFVDIIWFADYKYIASRNPSDRIYTTQQPLQNQNGLHKGVWLEVLLTFKETREEDFFINYTCQAQSSRGHPQAYFTLLPEDPDVLLPIGAVFSCLTFLFIISISIYYLYKVDIVLWFRSAFPVFYTNTDSDGKLYDAYVAYPQPSATGYNEEVEAFALQTLPEVLERSCGYKLFIAGRDCLPGEAMVDSVEENIQASRCLLLLYSASTFPSKTHTSSTSSTGSSNNNNHPKNYISEENNESKSVDVRSSRSSSSVVFNSDADEVHSDSRQQMECLAAMHRSLLEGSLKVVLVELEEITPAQLALFPESVRHLRKKQGAVCWWKERRAKKRWSRCGSKTGNVEQDSKASPSVSPSSMFWKEIRYHMPVRGKRVAYPEKTALLNL